jgi:hypothetical protein
VGQALPPAICGLESRVGRRKRLPHLVPTDPATIDARAGKVDGEGRIAAEEVGEFAVVVAIVDGEIGELAGL